MAEKEGYLCEVSWEVCNKVGGIYTVITSKAPYILKRIPNYLLIGPYFPQHPNSDFVEELVPDEFKDVIRDMKDNGLPCRYGRWLVKSEPRVILIDFSSLFGKKDEIKSKLWEYYKIDSLNSGFDFDEPVVFSVAAAQLINAIQQKTKKKIIAQFHEWMTGTGILWLKKINPDIASIFTTHATVLGRAITASHPSFYTNIKDYNPENEAKSLGVLNKHLVERTSAQQADVFTTVSEITALEAEYFLGRKADVLLLNGIDMETFASFEEVSIRHSELKRSIKDFIMSFFFPYYSFELDNALIFYVMGRYEFQNKGIDVLIDSLGKLNQHLKKIEYPGTIVTFFFIPAESHGINHDVLENKTYFVDLKDFIIKEQQHLQDRIAYLAASNQNLEKSNIFDEHFIEALEKKTIRFLRNNHVPSCTHDLKYYNQDAIIQAFQRTGLTNSKDEKVKVIFYPAYLRSADNLLNLDLYDAITGGHLGIFASAYEPWGYTPVESAALGVASVTSDLSGFGRFIKKETRPENPGIFVLDRFGKSYEEGVQNLFEILKRYSALDKEGRIQNKIEARRLASLTDWKKLIENYFKAFQRAAEKFN